MTGLSGTVFLLIMSRLLAGRLLHPAFEHGYLTSGSLAFCDGIADLSIIANGTNASWQHISGGRA